MLNTFEPNYIKRNKRKSKLLPISRSKRYKNKCQTILNDTINKIGIFFRFTNTWQKYISVIIVRDFSFPDIKLALIRYDLY